MNEPKKCECGCGEIVKPGNRFVNFHQNRGKNHPACGWNKGLTKEDHPGIMKQSIAISGRKRGPGWNKGLTKHDHPGIMKQSIAISGDNNPFKDVKITGPDSPAYIDGRAKKKHLWRKAVLQRDGNRCVVCGKGYDLSAHHIKSKREHPDLIYDVSNGATYCSSCHTSLHKKGHTQSEREKAKKRVAMLGRKDPPEVVEKKRQARKLWWSKKKED